MANSNWKTTVTKSDLAIWRAHLGAHAPTRFVVLNKLTAALRSG